jgi:flagellar protein FlaG
MEISSVPRLENQQLAAANAQAQVVARTPEERESDRNLVKAVKKLNESGFAGTGNELTFVFDRNTRRPLVRIVNKETREVIQQIPPEHVLRMAEELRESIRGRRG